jgi:transcriptional regulator with XRE-family HTH domain
MTFDEMIKNGREKLGVSLDVASKHFGISISYLSDFEHGRAKKIKMEFIYKAAGFYGLDADALCIAAGKIPTDVFYKISNHPHLFSAIRNLEV